MDLLLKRSTPSSMEDTLEEAKDEMLKRFKDKQMISWTKETKEMWIHTPSCSPVLHECNLFICKHIISSIYDASIGNSNAWNLDMLCQKWQLQNKDIGMILSFADSSTFIVDTNEFDDWGIEYHNITFQDKYPSESEIIDIMKMIYTYQNENPSLLVGLMAFPSQELAYFFAAHYFVRVKKMSKDRMISSLQLLNHIQDKELLSKLNIVTVTNQDSNWLHAFHQLTKRNVCSPMKIQSELNELPKSKHLMCSWIPKGDHIFVYILNGKGVMIKCEENVNHVLGVLPNLFVDAKNRPHMNTLCDGYLFSKAKPSFLRLLLTDVIYINGMSLKALPFNQRISALHKEIMMKVHERKAKDAMAVQNSPYKSIGTHDFWSIQQIGKIADSLIPSLTHEADGIVIIDASSSYVYGETDSKVWKYTGDVHSLSFYPLCLKKHK